MPTQFRHLPVDSLAACTHNWEQLAALIPEETIANSVGIAYRKAARGIPNATLTSIAVDTVIKDPGKNISTEKGVYVAPAEGYYHVDGQAQIVGGKLAIVAIFLNGTEVIRGVQLAETSVAAQATGIIFCKAKEEIDLRVYQGSGAEQKLELGEAFNRLMVMRVGEGAEGKQGPKGEAGSGAPPGGAENEALIWEAAGKAKWAFIKSANVEKESLEPNRLEKEKLTSEQVKPKGIKAASLAEGELTNTYIKAAAGIEESKLSLPEVVVKGTEQSIIGRKNFEPGAAVLAPISLYKNTLTTTNVEIAGILIPPKLTFNIESALFRAVSMTGEIIYEKPKGQYQLFGMATKILPKVSGVMGSMLTFVSRPSLGHSVANLKTTGWLPIAVDSRPVFAALSGEEATATGECVGLRHKLVKVQAGWTLGVNDGLLMEDATIEGGAITTQRALDVPDLKAGTTNYSVYSVGTEVKLKNAGPVELGVGLGVWSHAPPATQHAHIAKVEEASVLDTLLQLIEKTNEVVKKLNEVTQEALPEYGLTA